LNHAPTNSVSIGYKQLVNGRQAGALDQQQYLYNPTVPYSYQQQAAAASNQQQAEYSLAQGLIPYVGDYPDSPAVYTEGYSGMAYNRASEFNGVAHMSGVYDGMENQSEGFAQNSGFTEVQQSESGGYNGGQSHPGGGYNSGSQSQHGGYNGIQMQSGGSYNGGQFQGYPDEQSRPTAAGYSMGHPMNGGGYDHEQVAAFNGSGGQSQTSVYSGNQSQASSYGERHSAAMSHSGTPLSLDRKASPGASLLMSSVPNLERPSSLSSVPSSSVSSTASSSLSNADKSASFVPTGSIQTGHLPSSNLLSTSLPASALSQLGSSSGGAYQSQSGANQSNSSVYPAGGGAYPGAGQSYQSGVYPPRGGGGAFEQPLLYKQTRNQSGGVVDSRETEYQRDHSGAGSANYGGQGSSGAPAMLYGEGPLGYGGPVAAHNAVSSSVSKVTDGVSKMAVKDGVVSVGPAGSPSISLAPAGGDLGSNASSVANTTPNVRASTSTTSVTAVATVPRTTGSTTSKFTAPVSS